jgi:hypothetical protein
MAKNHLFWYVACVVALILGGLLTYWIMPTKVDVQTKEVIREVPTIQVQETIKEVPLDVKATYLEPALKDFVKEASKEDDFVYCDNQEYDEDQIKIKSDPRNWNVEIGQDQTLVNFYVKMKYLDKDVEEKCYRNYNVEVIYEDGEKPQVSF